MLLEFSFAKVAVLHSHVGMKVNLRHVASSTALWEQRRQMSKHSFECPLAFSLLKNPTGAEKIWMCLQPSPITALPNWRRGLVTVKSRFQ